MSVAATLKWAIVIDSELTVTQAARRLDITRSALSNVLNGKAALSPALAIRIEEQFGLDARELLIIQLDQEIAATRKRDR